MSELKPCGHCGARLSDVDSHGFHLHPSNDCLFSGFEISRDDVAKWNRRAAQRTDAGLTRSQIESIVGDSVNTAYYNYIMRQVDALALTQFICRAREAADLIEADALTIGRLTAELEAAKRVLTQLRDWRGLEVYGSAWEFNNNDGLTAHEVLLTNLAAPSNGGGDE